jgi:aminoglycoside phosphotransferase family enzyme/predicted kinase
MRTALADQRRLVAALGLPVVETHISYVLLGGTSAYKIKKAVDLDFLDFTTLDARRFYCGEELRLNRRLAPSLYLDVVPITGSVDVPVFGGQGPPIEYAVKMRQFDQEGLLTRVLARGELSPDRVDEIAAAVAGFHEGAAHAAPDAPFGRTANVLEPARQNFSQMLEAIGDPADRTHLEQLLVWTEAEAARLSPTFERRNREGCIRECHGDLHLGNIALVDGRVTLFDCVEFSPAMRWIDVMSDVAFLVMDLRDHDRPGLAARFLNGYLETTGDYQGLAVLRFYVIYRALVRAKIASLRLAQTADDAARARLVDEYRTYLAFATAETSPAHRGIFITHGVTGSGKTTRALSVVESVGAVRIRSDVERKRILGVDRYARTASPVAGGAYAADLTRRTYERLAALTRDIVTAGYAVVVDAAFLMRWQRDLLRAVAESLHTPFAIADCTAPEQVLRERLKRRLENGRDASEGTIEVLEYQLASADPLATDELALRQ